MQDEPSPEMNHHTKIYVDWMAHQMELLESDKEPFIPLNGEFAFMMTITSVSSLKESRPLTSKESSSPPSASVSRKSQYCP